MLVSSRKGPRLSGLLRKDTSGPEWAKTHRPGNAQNAAARFARFVSFVPLFVAERPSRIR